MDSSGSSSSTTFLLKRLTAGTLSVELFTSILYKCGLISEITCSIGTPGGSRSAPSLWLFEWKKVCVLFSWFSLIKFRCSSLFDMGLLLLSLKAPGPDMRLSLPPIYFYTCCLDMVYLVAVDCELKLYRVYLVCVIGEKAELLLLNPGRFSGQAEPSAYELCS